MNWRIPLATPEIGDEEVNAVVAVLKRKWLTIGEVTLEFERRFACKLGVKHALATSSCTAALHMANVALGIGEGDEVICPALTFVASANATRYTGAKVVFADVVSTQDLTISPEDIELKITSRTKALTIVHYAGFPCRMTELCQIAERHNLRIIEDCAHSPFAYVTTAGGTRRFVGAIGDIGCFSFYCNKNMTTGEGGMVTTNDDALFDRLRLLRSHGMSALAFERDRQNISQYDVSLVGYNHRMDEIRAAIGLCQLGNIDRLNAQRRRVYRWYLERLAAAPEFVVPFQHHDHNSSACHIMPVIIRGDADATRRRLAAVGVQTSMHYKPINSFPIYKGPVPAITDAIVSGLITLPLSAAMTEADVEFVSASLLSNR